MSVIKENQKPKYFRFNGSFENPIKNQVILLDDEGREIETICKDENLEKYNKVIESYENEEIIEVDKDTWYHAGQIASDILPYIANLDDEDDAEQFVYLFVKAVNEGAKVLIENNDIMSDDIRIVPVALVKEELSDEIFR